VYVYPVFFYCVNICHYIESIQRVSHVCVKRILCIRIVCRHTEGIPCVFVSCVCICIDTVRQQWELDACSASRRDTHQ